jgi:hypothetical protein
MLTFLLPICAAILCAAIEWVRITISHGKVKNINKIITWSVGVIMFAVCLSIILDYYDDASFFGVLFYGLYYASARGVMYDICLNKFRGLRWSYKSETTNSVLDKLYNSAVPFWLIRIVYVIILLISVILCLYFPLIHY